MSTRSRSNGCTVVARAPNRANTLSEGPTDEPTTDRARAGVGTGSNGHLSASLRGDNDHAGCGRPQRAGPGRYPCEDRQHGGVRHAPTLRVWRARPLTDAASQVFGSAAHVRREHRQVSINRFAGGLTQRRLLHEGHWRARSRSRERDRRLRSWAAPWAARSRTRGRPHALVGGRMAGVSDTRGEPGRRLVRDHTTGANGRAQVME